MARRGGKECANIILTRETSMQEYGLTDDDIERYSRHILLPEVGLDGQERLHAASVLMVGAGGLGSAALVYLAAAGVGRIGIADGDAVDLSNLQRQVIHRTADVGLPKVESAAKAIRAINPGCDVRTHPVRLTARNIRSIVRQYDLVLDGSDNFPTRFLVADCCWFEKIPLVSAAAIRFEGQLMSVLPEERSPCYRCFVPGLPPVDVPTCQQAGVLGPVPGVMGTLQAIEVIKVLLGVGQNLAHGLLVFDALKGTFRTAVRKCDPGCVLCGPKSAMTELIEYEMSCCSPEEMKRGCCCSPGGGSEGAACGTDNERK